MLSFDAHVGIAGLSPAYNNLLAGNTNSHIQVAFAAQLAEWLFVCG